MLGASQAAKWARRDFLHKPGNMLRHRQHPSTWLALWAITAVLAAPAFAGQQQDPIARWRARIDEAKRLNIPAPPKGVRDTPWQALSPAHWDAEAILRQIRASGAGGDHQHGEGADPLALEVESEIQRAWDEAPTVPATHDAPIRLTGYAVMLQPGQGLARSVLLVPYNGVGQDRRAPPANQMVLVTFKSGLPRNLEQRPIWVTGHLYRLATQTDYGRVAYVMPQARWQKFPVEQFPMPKYRPVR